MTEYLYYDHQGEQFTVEAESQSMADAIARAEADVRTTYAYELSQALGEERIVAINGKIQSAYDAAMCEHNAAISFGTDQRSGLRGLPYVPELPDPGGYSTSIYRNGYPQARTATLPQKQSDGGFTCVAILLAAAAVIVGLAACKLAEWISFVY